MAYQPFSILTVLQATRIPGSRFCREEFQYDSDKNGKTVNETAWDQNHHMVWGFVYLPSQAQDNTRQTMNASFSDRTDFPSRNELEAKLRSSRSNIRRGA